MVNEKIDNLKSMIMESSDAMAEIASILKDLSDNLTEENLDCSERIVGFILNSQNPVN